jgi:hypothetical protein
MGMLREKNLVILKEELDQSLIFKKMDAECYDFAHPSLREYCVNELPNTIKTKLHSQAAKCLENLIEVGL